MKPLLAGSQILSIRRAKCDDILLCHARVERCRFIKGISRSLRTNILKKLGISRGFARARAPKFPLATILIIPQPKARAFAPHHAPVVPVAQHHQIVGTAHVQVGLASRYAAAGRGFAGGDDGDREVEAVDYADVVEVLGAGVGPEGHLDYGGRRFFSCAHAAELTVAVTGQAGAVACPVEAAAVAGPHPARPPLGGLDHRVVAAVEVEAAVFEDGLAGVAEEGRPNVVRAVVHYHQIVSWVLMSPFCKKERRVIYVIEEF